MIKKLLNSISETESTCIYAKYIAFNIIHPANYLGWIAISAPLLLVIFVTVIMGNL